MRAVRVHELGGPEVLTLDDIDVPEPGPGQIRVRIEAAGLNFIDTYHRDGKYDLDLPATIGVEAGGTVDAVGSDVDGISEGDRVAYTGQRGAYAEQQVVPADAVVAVPDELGTEQAVASLLQGMTAHYLTHDTFPLQDGDTALVHAAAGGVGHLLTQICKLRGARVIATCGTDEKAKLVRDFGADEVIVYTKEDFVSGVQEATNGRGVDVVYDGVGKATFEKGLDCIRKRGMMVLYGQASGPASPLDPQELNQHGSLFLTRPSLFDYVAERSELEQRATDLYGWLANGDIEVRIDRSFGLEEAAEAHRYLEGRKTHGKVLLTP
ncbi:MAG: quinone oxidoreductase [Nitriliruptorales bacterium]|nr:quinone oxidoreductase [Nitriliruptorales bacterium]